MDTQSMVQQLMRAESMRMDRLTRRRTLVQWRQEALRSNITTFTNFRNQQTDFARAGTITNEQSWNTTRSTVTNSNPTGNTNGITVNTTNNSRPGTFDIQVIQTAQGDLIQGSMQFRTDLNLDIRLSHLGQGEGAGSLGTTISGVNTNLNINGTNVRIGADYTLRQTMAAVNNSAAGVNMRFDSIRGRFVIESRTTGEEATVTTGNDNWGVLRALGLNNVDYANFTPPSQTHTSIIGAQTAPSGLRITPSTSVFDAIPGLNAGDVVVVGGRDVVLAADETFLSFILAANQLLAGDPTNANPALHDDLGFRLDVGGDGRFFVRMVDPTAVAEIGDSTVGTSNTMLNFMFGQDTFTVNNRAYTDGITFEMRDFPGLAPTTLLGDMFGFTGMWEATFNVDGNFVVFDENSTFADFVAAFNITGVMRADFDAVSNSIQFRAYNPGDLVPTITMLPAGGGNDINRAHAIGIMNGMFDGITGGSTMMNNRITQSNNQRTPDVAHHPFLNQELGTSRSVAITVGTGASAVTETYTFGPNATYQDVMDWVNSIPGAYMTFNNANGTFTLTTAGSPLTASMTANGFDFMGFAPVAEITPQTGFTPDGRPAQVTSRPVPVYNLTPSSPIFNFIPPASASTITLGGRTTTLNPADTFWDIMTEMNRLLAGDPTNANPAYHTDAGFRIDVSADGSFFVRANANNPATTIEIGENGVPNTLLNFMFGQDYFTIDNTDAESGIMHAYNPILDRTISGVEVVEITVGTGADATTTTLVFMPNQTHRQVMDQINAIAGVEMTFNHETAEFTLRSTAAPGADTHFSIGGLGFLNFENPAVPDLEEPPSRVVRAAQDAIIYYDVGSGGLDPVRITQASNTFNIHGTNITLSGNVETGTVGADGVRTGGIFTIGVERDIEDTMQTIRDFVEEYNNLIRLLNAQHSTPRPRHGNSRTGTLFEPLTDEERAGMSDREIERWEEQARTGLLHRDNDLRNMQQQLRDMMFRPVRLNDGTTISLHEVGIQTVGMNGPAGDRLIGVLEIDETRLRAALEANPDNVRQLFARNHIEAQEHDGDSLPDGQRINMALTTATQIRQHGINVPHIGLGFRLNEVLHIAAVNPNSPFIVRAGYAGNQTTENHMSRQIADYNRRIDQMQQFLLRRENHFFSMFARMEQAMAQSHAQMDSLFAFMTQ